MGIKSIIIFGVNYYPEDTAIGLYSTQMAEFLRKKGFSVTVVTGFPYYPGWKISKTYNPKPTFYKEEINGVSIYRYKQYVPAQPTFLKRVIHLTDFTIGSIFNLFKIKNADLVISIIPFTSCSFVAGVFSWWKKSKHWVHIQDFEFDAAFETSLGTKSGIGSIISNLLFKIESKIFNSSDIVSTISHSMMKKLKNKTDATTFYLPNWIDEHNVNPNFATQHSYLQSNKFKVLYAGNIGAKQDWQLFIDVVNEFKNDTDIEFIVVGDGAKKQWLVEKTRNISCVKHFNPVPFKELNNLLCSADLHILFQKYEVVDTVMPSKLLGMMASARTILVTGNESSEVARIIKNNELGFFFRADKISNIIKFINEFKRKNSPTSETGYKARTYVIEKYSQKAVLNSLVKKIEDLLI